MEQAHKSGRYIGQRTTDAGPLPVYFVESPSEGIKRLNPRNDVVNHSPDGLQWGYGGSGPAQLALAILCHYLRLAGHPFPDGRAVVLHQDFKWKFIAPVKGDLCITTEEIGAWIAQQAPESEADR